MSYAEAAQLPANDDVITVLTGSLRIEKPACMLMMLCYYRAEVRQP